MSNDRATPKRRIPGVGWDRRADPDDQSVAGWLRRLKGLVGRPMRLAAADGHVRLVVVERRRRARTGEGASLRDGFFELGERLLAHDPDEAAQTMRHLVFVYDELGRKGWAGVQKQSSHVIGKALMQAEMLVDTDPSPALAMMIERLRACATAARAREERSVAVRAAAVDDSMQVSEVSYDEFRETEMSWVGTRPCGLETDASSK